MAKKPFSVLFPEDCTELTGVRRCDWKSQVTDLVVNVPFTPGDIPRMQDCTVFFHWPAEFGFLSLAPKDKTRDLHRSGETARQAAVSFYKNSGTPLRPKLVADNWFVYRFADADAKETGKDGLKVVSIVISIDTAHEGFRAYAERLSHSHEPLAIDIDVDIGGAKDSLKTVELQQDKVALKVTIPVRRLEPYDGVVAIDFGNTNSTLVACDDEDGVIFVPSDMHDVESGQSLAAAARIPMPTPTVLELLEYTPQAEQGKPGAYRLNYGTQALTTEQPARLITGAKRMLADMPEGKSSPRMLRAIVGDEAVPVPIPSHEPAEIFISRMFEAFLYFVRKEPKRVAITCPSTFSEAEANRTRIATINGLRRALRQFDRLHAPDSRVTDKSAATTIRPCLDESTAAAFWFIHEDVLEKRGRGAIEFQYLYPQGMNVLIYDCGGGTTDISLVKVGYEKGTARLRIDVLGRRGHRTFGGDYITLQYARYVKYQIFAKAKGRSDDDEMDRFFADSTSGKKSALIDAVNNVFPTLFDSSAPRVGTVAEARARAWVLWTLAERLKCLGFEADDESGEMSSIRRSDFADFFRRLSRLRNEPTNEENRLTERVGEHGFEIDKDHIRRVLAPVLDETIRYANELVAGCLPSGEEVHRVYLVGNASRCPIISERMLDEQHGLSIRFLGEKLVQHGKSATERPGPAIASEDLKNCVAKGAAVAIALQNQQKAIADWDEDVMKKLPYSIEYQDPARAYPRVLFDCGTLMDRSRDAEETIQIHADAKERVLTNRIRLSRRWPGAGDKELEEFLVFRFPQPLVEGRYRVSYDGGGYFRASCLEKSHKTLVAKGEPIVFPPTVPPSQSGEF